MEDSRAAKKKQSSMAALANDVGLALKIFFYWAFPLAIFRDGYGAFHVGHPDYQSTRNRHFQIKSIMMTLAIGTYLLAIYFFGSPFALLSTIFIGLGLASAASFLGAFMSYLSLKVQHRETRPLTPYQTILALLPVLPLLTMIYEGITLTGATPFAPLGLFAFFFATPATAIASSLAILMLASCAVLMDVYLRQPKEATAVPKPNRLIAMLNKALLHPAVKTVITFFSLFLPAFMLKGNIRLYMLNSSNKFASNGSIYKQLVSDARWRLSAMTFAVFSYILLISLLGSPFNFPLTIIIGFGLASAASFLGGLAASSQKLGKTFRDSQDLKLPLAVFLGVWTAAITGLTLTIVVAAVGSAFNLNLGLGSLALFTATPATIVAISLAGLAVAVLPLAVYTFTQTLALWPTMAKERAENPSKFTFTLKYLYQILSGPEPAREVNPAAAAEEAVAEAKRTKITAQNRADLPPEADLPGTMVDDHEDLSSEALDAQIAAAENAVAATPDCGDSYSNIMRRNEFSRVGEDDRDGERPAHTEGPIDDRRPPSSPAKPSFSFC